MSDQNEPTATTPQATSAEGVTSSDGVGDGNALRAYAENRVRLWNPGISDERVVHIVDELMADDASSPTDSSSAMGGEKP